MRRYTSVVAALIGLACLTPPASASSGRLDLAGSASEFSVGSVRVQAPYGLGMSGLVGSSGGTNLSFGGGTPNQGIQVHPAGYAVFWGSQWSHDDPLASYEQRFLKGIYGRGDDWSAVTQEYCDGVAKGTQTCPSSKQHVGRPTGSFLKGIWFDASAPAVPQDLASSNGATPIDTLAREVIAAAAHFGNKTPRSNVGAQYVINTPDHFNTLRFSADTYCAMHGIVHSTYGDLAFTYMPYITNAESVVGVGPYKFGVSCGQNMVNSGQAGTYDGVSIGLGHEILETVTDADPGTGWTDAKGNENADKCAYIFKGQGAMANLRLSTGTFAVQSTWSNAFNHGAGGCVLHSLHP